MRLPSRTEYTDDVLGGVHQGPPRFRVETECVSVPRELVDADNVSEAAVRLYVRFAVAAAFGLGPLDVTRDYGADLAGMWAELELAGWLSDPSASGLLVLHSKSRRDPPESSSPLLGRRLVGRGRNARGRVLELDHWTVECPVWLVMSNVSDAAVRLYLVLAAAPYHPEPAPTLDEALDGFDWLTSPALEALLELVAVGALQDNGWQLLLRTACPQEPT